MNKRRFQIINKKNKRGEQAPKLAKSRSYQVAGLQPSKHLTPAEAIEAARFRAFSADKAARQAMLRRIMAELEDLDGYSPAA